MSNPLVTIAIPTFNRAEANLRDDIDVSLRLTYPNIEVLVGDNASTDGTEELVASFDDPRLRYIRHDENIGANANFNYLLNHASGEWFLLFHDDDLIDPDFVESCIGAIEPGQEYGFIRTGVRSIDADGRVMREIPNDLIGPGVDDFYLSWFSGKTAFYLCNTLYHTQRLRDVGGFHSPHYLMEDNCALVRLLEQWGHANVRDVKASYRYTYDQRTYKVPVVEWCEDFDFLLDMIREQVSPSRKDYMVLRARQFFGSLCVRRANANKSVFRQIRDRMIIARFFGLRSLRFTWQRPDG